jgi:cytochrome c oxidase assembly factor CtaG/putative copper export protein
VTLTALDSRSGTSGALGTAPLTLVGAALAALAVAAVAFGLVVAGGTYQPPLPGLPDPGALVGWGMPVLRTLTNLAAVVTIGWLLAATVLDPSGKDGVVSKSGRRDLVRAAWAAAVWALLALTQMLFELANVLGLPLSQAVSGDQISTFVNEIPSTRALLVMALLALVVAFGAAMSSTTGAAAAWLILALAATALPALAGHSAGLGDHALATTSGVAHVVASVVWVGGLFALAAHAARRDQPMERAVQRFSTIALVAILLTAASGFGNAYTRLDTPSQLFTTGYGQLLVLKTGLIIALAVIGWLMRERIIPTLSKASRVGVFARIAGLELLVMAVAIGLGVALASSPIPRIEVQLPSLGESMLGFPYPPAPTFLGVVGGFHLDPLFFTGSLIAGALYITGMVKLRRRGDAWPVMRTVSWVIGLLIVMWCTSSGIALYAQLTVGLHMLQHMTMTMMGPIFLVLGAPATLALRALKPAHGNERGPREWLVWFLHSWITRVLTNPFFVFFIFALGLYGLYMTPLFGFLMGSHVGHVVMQLHFLFAGYLFYWVLIGIDPRPRPLPYWARLLLLLVAMAVHAFFAVIMMMGTTPMAIEWYGVVRPPWVADPLLDTLQGGQVAWAVSEIPSLIVLLVISFQWSRSDQREATRSDRQADRDGDAELRAYNEHLASLATRDRRQR